MFFIDFVHLGYFDSIFDFSEMFTREYCVLNSNSVDLNSASGSYFRCVILLYS